ncbi:MAG TPA: phosphoglycerate mutase family protein [Thermoanaerobaculia bacterium]|nr:phosphoglycerate mutase family protein [Thermoanaerobaculia bacterium]
MRTSTRIATLAVLLFATFAWATPPPPCTTIIIVRHAEQTDPTATDPPLSPAGAARAAALAVALEHSGVQAIYVTQFKRTKQTAARVASLLHVPVTEVPVDLAHVGEYPRQLARRIFTEHPSGTVLVVSHSNTVPGIVSALTNIAVHPLASTEYDRFTVVTAGPSGCQHVLQAQYGH